LIIKFNWLKKGGLAIVPNICRQAKCRTKRENLGEALQEPNRLMRVMCPEWSDSEVRVQRGRANEVSEEVSRGALLL